MLGDHFSFDRVCQCGVELLQGLKADERVAVQGAGFLNEGDLVKVAQ